MFILEDSIGQLTKIEADTSLLNKTHAVPLSGSFTEVEQYLDQEKEVFCINNHSASPHK